MGMNTIPIQSPATRLDGVSHQERAIDQVGKMVIDYQKEGEYTDLNGKVCADCHGIIDAMEEYGLWNDAKTAPLNVFPSGLNRAGWGGLL